MHTATQYYVTVFVSVTYAPMFRGYRDSRHRVHVAAQNWTLPVLPTHVYPVTIRLEYLPDGFYVGNDVVSSVNKEHSCNAVPAFWHDHVKQKYI